MVYEAKYIIIISIGLYLYFNTEILAPLKVFKNSLFYHVLKDTPVNLRYIHAI